MNKSESNTGSIPLSIFQFGENVPQIGNAEQIINFNNSSIIKDPIYQYTESKPVAGDDWKQSIMFLVHYGYDMNKLTPKSRIRIIHDDSLSSVGGRSAPFACNLLKYLEKHPDCRIAFKADKEKELPQHFWCKNCGRILDSILPHQVTCLYHGSAIDSSTFPNDVYAFIDNIDNIPDNDDLYDDNMQFWFSAFGQPHEILDQNQTEEHDGMPPIEENVQCDLNIQFLMNYWLSIAGDDQLTISSYAVTLIQECLDLFYANIIEEANDESRRRAGEGERCLVPSLIGGIISSNKYLKFISNYGLRKPEPVI